ncbi:endolytic transglycosylase MltG [Panacibacter ginsenosidivorans]|nr:endolytic transglycosylase MltG [Panacibacter ginsenosidivorans]
MKKKLFFIAAFIILLLLTGAWLLFGPSTSFDEKNKYLFVRSGENIQQQVEAQVDTGNIVHFPFIFKVVASQTGVWDKLKPGRFEIKKGTSIFNMVRMLRNNVQSPVKLVINKLRTKENFAKLLGKNFSFDSAAAMQFLTSNDSLLQLGVDTNTVFTMIIPDTYLFNWNTRPRNLLTKLKEQEEKYWNSNRLQLAQEQGLTPRQVYTIASIVEEETNKDDEKGSIASVYINRMNKGMPLGADPTVKYALRDFALKRIYFKHLAVESPYNTYRYKGLPPGPICTPSQTTIDAVLNAPKTDYLFFVAKSDFSGYHHFSNNFAEHDRYAKEYQQALDTLIKNKQKQQD